MDYQTIEQLKRILKDIKQNNLNNTAINLLSALIRQYESILTPIESEEDT